MKGMDAVRQAFGRLQGMIATLAARVAPAWQRLTARVAALPGVGKNLQDHLAALLIYGRRDESPLLRHMRYDRLLMTLGQGLLAGTGFATELPGGITGFIKTSPDEPIPDIQLLFIAGSLAAKPYLPPFSQPFADSFACRIVLLRPESRGSITLASANPAAPSSAMSSARSR